MAETPPTVSKALTERLIYVKQQAEPFVDLHQMIGPGGKPLRASDRRRRRAGANLLRRTPMERVSVTAKFVHNQNIHRFMEMLRTELDPRKRAVIERLLAEERANTPDAGLTASSMTRRR